MRVRAVILAAMLAVPTGAMAQEKEGDSSGRVLGGLRACRGLPDAERLACYDRAASALDAAVASKEVTVLDKQEVRRTRRGLFGFTLPRIGLFAGDGDEKEADAFIEITSTVASARTVENSRIEFRLADETEAVWRTTDPLGFPPKTGTEVTIRKGALGNYFIRFKGTRPVRGMRVR